MAPSAQHCLSTLLSVRYHVHHDHHCMQVTEGGPVIAIAGLQWLTSIACEIVCNAGPL